MNSTLKKYIWIPIAIMLGLGIWYFLKAKVYDIKVPEKPLTYKLWEATWFKYDPMQHEFYLNGGDLDFLNVNTDSITWPKGSILPKDTVHGVNRILFSSPNMELPLQVVKIWKDGFVYYKVLRFHRPVMDAKYPWSKMLDTIWQWNNDLYLGQPYLEHMVNECEVYKESFDENKIILTLEKQNPVKIVALWENFAIVGETDGKSIKITVPRIATKYANSVIRVWACDSNHVSRTCEIPLRYGIIPTKMKVQTPREMLMLQQFKKWVSLLNLSSFDMTFEQERMLNDNLDLLSEDPEYAAVMVYGDVRMMRLRAPLYTIVSSYFGKKIVCIFNPSDQKSEISFPFKGDLKHSANGTVFKLKGSNLMLTLPPKSYEILY